MPKKSATETSILLVFSLTLVWVGLFFARPLWIQPWCAVQPSPCLVASVNSFDQISFRYGSIVADFISNLFQNLVGVLALLLPWFLLKDRPRLALRITFFMLILTISNGILLEIVRGIVQRPRPLVFRDPMGDGANVSHYTSFYSGHTSFMTLACYGTYLWNRFLLPENRRINQTLLITSISFPVLMAILRVWGGRHYPTDTLGAMVFAGTLSFLLFKPFKKAEKTA